MASGDATDADDFQNIVVGVLSEYGDCIPDQLRYILHMSNTRPEFDVNEFMTTDDDDDYCLVAAYLRLMHVLYNYIPIDKEILDGKIDDKFIVQYLKTLGAFMDKFDMSGLDEDCEENIIDTKIMVKLWKLLGEKMIPLLRKLVKEDYSYKEIRIHIENIWKYYLRKVQKVANILSSNVF